MVESCMDTITSIRPDPKTNRPDPLKAPIEVRFKDEPGIDEGGVRKEFFHIMMEKLFSKEFGMYEHNEDN